MGDTTDNDNPSSLFDFDHHHHPKSSFSYDLLQSLDQSSVHDTDSHESAANDDDEDLDDGERLTLDPSTLAILDSFLASKAEEEKRFNALKARVIAAAANGGKVVDIVGYGDNDDDRNPEELSVEGIPTDRPMSVDEYKLTFGEDWQLSQFWYTTESATELANHLHALLSSPPPPPVEPHEHEPPTIAFLCCPTGYVAFQHERSPTSLARAVLFEYDRRFAMVVSLEPEWAKGRFVPYNVREPDDFPQDLRGKVDIVVVDPPFLNEDTNFLVVQTIKHILRPLNGKILLLTSTSTQGFLNDMYGSTPPVGPLRKTRLSVDCGRLANEYAVWGSWEGAEHFGSSGGVGV